MKPEYKLLITYDILPGKQDSYYRYVLGEFVPTLRNMGVHMTSAWHTAYGKYPARCSNLRSKAMMFGVVRKLALTGAG